MEDFEIKILGSVSPYCKGSKNCVGFLVKHNHHRFLLDCGNGITRNMSLPDDLDNLNVFITHMHKDHYGELSSIDYAAYVYHNYGILKNKIKIYASDINRVHNDINYSEYFKINDDDVIKIDDIKIIFHDNKSHGIKSYMIKLESKDNILVYTSDIGNTNLDDVIRFSENADLLICESSLLKENNSRLKTHLHAYESAIIAREAKVKQLMLTHFWPEIEKTKYLDEAKMYFENTIVAEEKNKLILRR